MSARQGHRGPKIWAGDRGDAIRWAVRTLAQAFRGEGRRPDWREATPSTMETDPKGRAKMVRRCPAKGPLPGTREPGYWRPRYSREERRGSAWQPSPMQRPRDWRRHSTPRRGPPVAAIKVPRWHRPGAGEERWPRGPEPRGPLRGGPERSAGDSQRKPHGSPCGGPARSSDDPRLSKTTQPKAKREANGK